LVLSALLSGLVLGKPAKSKPGGGGGGKRALA